MTSYTAVTAGTPMTYAQQDDWRELQRFLPQRLQILDDADLPREEFWNWNGHRVHLDRYENSGAPAKVVLHHGVGTNGRQMTLILGKTLADRGWEVVALDNLGYGMTQVDPDSPYTYDDWVQLVIDYLAYEKAKDDRPIVLYGLSAGGMLAYQVAAAAPPETLAGIVGMTFLDQRVQQVRDETARDKIGARLGARLMHAMAKTRLGSLRIPMTRASKMTALVNDRSALKVMLADKTSAGNSVTIRFLDRYLNYSPAVEPSPFDACRVLLTQPAEDRWSPQQLSEPVLSKITRVPVSTVLLDNAGHYPIEEPGLRQMQDAIDEFVQEVTGQR